MPNTVVLVTGANGEIGRSLLRALAQHGGYEVASLDLTPLAVEMRQLVAASYVGNIMDRHLLDQLAAQHELDVVFHLAALLSTRGERDPELAHHINVEGTLNVLRVAQKQSSRSGLPVRFLFPSSIAVYGLPSLEVKASVGRVREEQWTVPITMYGCNKLYCEHLGRYFTLYAGQLGMLAAAARVDFRALRLPGLMSAETVPGGGTSDFGPEMIHAAAQGLPYRCFVEPEATIPFMAMPDAVRALLELSRADRGRLSSCVYNIGAFSVSAGEIGDRVRRAFHGAQIDYRPDPARARIVASWPADVDDGRARADWGWRPEHDWGSAFDAYLAPRVRALYSGR
ncbi:MAG TPA: NAD-dependent epimerase/dehydratase family protein [Polyangiaceae bacterium]|nr:NAD-dependent epimerase/dehydratase family protein [Polyangiaceae bacterium]